MNFACVSVVAWACLDARSELRATFMVELMAREY